MADNLLAFDPSPTFPQLINVIAKEAGRPLGVIGRCEDRADVYVYWPITERYLCAPELTEILDKLKDLNSQFSQTVPT